MTKLALIIVLISFQATFILATVPLKCLLKESELLNMFSKKSISGEFRDAKNNIGPFQLDPIRIDYFSENVNGLQMTNENVEYTGFNDAMVDEFRVNFNNNITKISFHTDISLKCFYKTEGVLFSLPMNGEGLLTASFKNTKIEMVMPFEIIKDDSGQKYIELKSYYVWQDLPNGEFNFHNLYDGNKERGETMNSLINQNFRVFTQEFGKPYMKKIVSSIFQAFRNYMLSIPLKDLNRC